MLQVSLVKPIDINVLEYWIHYRFLILTCNNYDYLRLWHLYMQMWCFTVWAVDSKVVPQRSCRWASSAPDVPCRERSRGSICTPAFCPLNFSDNSITLAFAFPLPYWPICSSTLHVQQTHKPLHECPDMRGNASCHQHIWFDHLLSTLCNQNRHISVTSTWQYDDDIRCWKMKKDGSAFIHNEGDNTFYDAINGSLRFIVVETKEC